jgi:hypothetical protein
MLTSTDSARTSPPRILPPDPPLVAHVIQLYKDGTDYETENRVGNGYMVSVVEKEGRNNYNMYHQVVLQPWIDAVDGRTWDYNAGLCNDPEPVHVCLQYDTGECVKFEYRNACTGSFLGLQSETANRLPATTRGGLTFTGYMDGFITGLSGNVNNANGILDHAPAGFEPYVVNYSWPHGRVCVTYGGDVQPPPEPEPDPEPGASGSQLHLQLRQQPRVHVHGREQRGGGDLELDVPERGPGLRV